MAAQRTRRQGIRHHGVLVGCAVVLALGACNPIILLIDAPDFRGITIPLPPPSFADVPKQTVVLDGTIGGDPPPGAVVRVWESIQAHEQGEPIDDNGDFSFAAVEVTLERSCLQLYLEYDEGNEHYRSQDAFYELILLTDELCGADPMVPCSERDQEGTCVCLDRRDNGC